VAGEVARALNYDIEEKKIQLEVLVESVVIEADEQLLRQALFNLVLNAIQAVRPRASSASGPAGAAMRRPSSRFPTTARACRPRIAAKFSSPTSPRTRKGPALGLSVVQQIVLAHGWEIQCLANEPAGALFRISHVKLRSRSEKKRACRISRIQFQPPAAPDRG
jgi:signal transduction histidine kinase